MLVLTARRQILRSINGKQFFALIADENAVISKTEQEGCLEKTFFFKFNPSPPQIVRLVIETPYTKFQLIQFTGRGEHAI